ncbi:hypothetical protein [Tumebacillus permanentifrigoris]|uniref:Uncharacterized protein n=1 Tax=Tumebacillus permanentifrigoris TaxID=378543 RepID=A0A316D6B1_9BACL|nr:hypothetical protein [Tumebacillus permanentifrigoris]PWK07481.1 hypothetical protein C7459_11780 [Tumebacillus permanentifrigoris]
MRDGVRQVVRKPVEFNLGKEEDYLAHEYLKQIPNFAGFVKKQLANAERQRRERLKAQLNATQHSAAQRQAEQ